MHAPLPCSAHARHGAGVGTSCHRIGEALGERERPSTSSSNRSSTPRTMPSAAIPRARLDASHTSWLHQANHAVAELHLERSQDLGAARRSLGALPCLSSLLTNDRSITVSLQGGSCQWILCRIQPAGRPTFSESRALQDDAARAPRTTLWRSCAPAYIASQQT